MAAFTVHQGKRYRATISLGMLESFASNDIIAGRLRTAGFTDISVSGAGNTRIAEALWSAADATAELPSRLRKLLSYQSNRRVTLGAGQVNDGAQGV